MSMGRWVFLFIPIFSAAFSGGVCVQVLCHRGGGDGLQSHADEEEGLYLASIYLSISASIEKRSNWKQLLKPTYDQGEAEEDCGEENWMARGEFSFGRRKIGTICKENNLSGEFPRFCEKIPIIEILITPRMEELSGAWDYGVWLEKYLLGPILEFPRWDISNFRARRYLAILGHPHRLTEFTFGNKKFNIWYHLAIVVQIDQDLVF